MRVFLCSYGGFSIAIPMSFVSSLTLLAEDAAVQDVPVYCHDDLGTCVSLPRLFELPTVNARHGITLNDDTGKNKIVLLSTEVECEKEIPDEEIHPVPKVLSGARFFSLFSGIKFAACPVFVLKSGQLILKAQTEAPVKKAI